MSVVSQLLLEYYVWSTWDLSDLGDVEPLVSNERPVTKMYNSNLPFADRKHLNGYLSKQWILLISLHC